MSSDSSRKLPSRHRAHEELDVTRISSNLKAERLTSQSPMANMRPDKQENGKIIVTFNYMPYILKLN